MPALVELPVAVLAARECQWMISLASLATSLAMSLGAVLAVSDAGLQAVPDDALTEAPT